MTRPPFPSKRTSSGRAQLSRRAVRLLQIGRGLCKRASLVLLELLHREGVEDAELWHLGMQKEGSSFASSDEHYVIVNGAETIHATVRQFDQARAPITRRSLKEVSRAPSSATSKRRFLPHQRSSDLWTRSGARRRRLSSRCTRAAGATPDAIVVPLLIGLDHV
jgi:hypothetical protein